MFQCLGYAQGVINQQMRPQLQSKHAKFTLICKGGGNKTAKSVITTIDLSLTKFASTLLTQFSVFGVC
jgi:hypothetical protein